MRKNILHTCVLLFATILLVGVSTKTYASSTKLATPENPIVYCESAHSLKLKWKRVEGATGYRIYRYNKSKKKFVKVKTIKEQKNNWTNKNLKVHKVYQYKISAYKKTKNGNKKFSKKSYPISARTYGKHGRVVNVTQKKGVDIELSNETKELGICSVGQAYSYLTNDYKVVKLNTKLVSDKVIWSSSDSSIVSVDANGKLTTYEKSGKVTLFARAHNGVIGKLKINVVNYARPESFPKYYGNIKEINSLLKDYKKEVCDIAEFFTIYNNEDEYSTITVKDGKIVGIPEIKDISLIENAIKKIINEYPYPVDIYCEKGYVEFKIGENVTIEYDANNSYDDYPKQIAPHWLANKFIGA